MLTVPLCRLVVVPSLIATQDFKTKYSIGLELPIPVFVRIPTKVSLLIFTMSVLSKKEFALYLSILHAKRIFGRGM